MWFKIQNIEKNIKLYIKIVLINNSHNKKPKLIFLDTKLNYNNYTLNLPKYVLFVSETPKPRKVDNC